MGRRRRDMNDYYAAWVHQIKAPIAVMKILLQQQDTRENRELSAELFRVEQYAEMALSYIRLGEGASDLVIRECDLDEDHPEDGAQICGTVYPTEDPPRIRRDGHESADG